MRDISIPLENILLQHVDNSDPDYTADPAEPHHQVNK